MKKGYTLLELVVAMGIMVLLVGVLGSVVVQTWQTITFQETTRQSQDRLQGGLARVFTVATQAKAVLANYESYTSSESTLVLQIPSLDSDQQIILTSNDVVIYKRNPEDQTKLEEIIIPDPVSSRPAVHRTLITDIESLDFTYYNHQGESLAEPYMTAQRVLLSLTIHPSKSRQPISTQQQITLRNYQP